MYCLGIDVGTTWTAAATWRAGRAEMVTLGAHVAAMPSVVVVRADGVVLTGEAAERRALGEPGRVAREFKRRIGDPTPILVGGQPFTAEALTAELLRAVVQAAAGVEGGPPDRIVVTHPASWGSYKLQLLEQAVALADLDSVQFVAEPEAAAIHYASTERLAPGEMVAVYDFGGGTFDAAVLRNSGTGFERLGEPSGVDRLGGIDFDAAVFEFVRNALGGALEAIDPDDDNAMAAVMRLREECVEAKEALSSDVEVLIPVLLPGLSTELRLARSEFEDLIRPSVLSTVEALRRAVRSAGIEPSRLTRVLLVGGSSRIPLVAQLVGNDLGCPVSVDAHPKHAIALGAAIAASAVATDSDTTALAAGTQVVHAVPPGTTVPLASAAAAAALAGADPVPPGAFDPSGAPSPMGPPPMGPVGPAPWLAPPGPPADLGEPSTVPVVDPDSTRTGELPVLDDPAAPAWPAAAAASPPWPAGPAVGPPPAGSPPHPGDPYTARGPAGTAPAYPVGPPDTGRPPGGKGRRTGLLVALALLLVLAVGGAAVALGGGGNGTAAKGDKSDPDTTVSDQSSSDQSSSDASEPKPPKSTTTSTSTTTTKPKGPAGPLAVTSATASDFAPNGVDGGGNAVTYEPGNLVDGAPDTCWRVGGDGSGVTFAFAVARSSEITKVGLLPGYAKIDSFDGTDRWLQNRRPTTVRWSFDDGTSIDQDLADNRDLQLIAVSATTRTVRLEILGATPATDRDLVAISEIAIEGRG